MPAPDRLELPGIFDAHAHLRQEPVMKPLVMAHLQMGCFGVVAMPNTVPPLTTLDSISQYRGQVLRADSGQLHDVIVPLYLADSVTPQLIEDGAKTGTLKAVKYYPPHGTTNSGGAIPMELLLGSAPKRNVLRAMAANDIVFCVHGEQHGLPAEIYFDQHRNAETVFYNETMPRLREAEPELKIVAEHITTETAASFVRMTEKVVATVTPQHLLYTIGDWAQMKSNHLVCMPLVKFRDDRLMLLNAVTDPANTKFFLGTDSAPHPEASKALDCGCAAGCFTGGVAPQLYLMAFEQAETVLHRPFNEQAFRRFAYELGAAFYGVSVPDRPVITLVRATQAVAPVIAPDGQELVVLPRGFYSATQRDQATLPWRIERPALA